MHASVAKVVSGDGQALTLEVLFRRHAGDVCRIVSRLLGPSASNADVDDIAQQVFLQIHRALPRFRGESQVTTWIYGISARVVWQELRTRRRYRAMVDRFEQTSIPDPPAGVEETLEQREALKRVWGALVRIDADRRVVLVLHELEGLSAKEIGGLLELSEEAVRSRLRRGRKELEEHLLRAKEDAR